MERIAEVEKALPFEILDFDCDNGGEFLNRPKTESPVQSRREFVVGTAPNRPL